MYSYEARRLLPGSPRSVRSAIDALLGAMPPLRTRILTDEGMRQTVAISADVASEETDIWLTWSSNRTATIRRYVLCSMKPNRDRILTSKICSICWPIKPVPTTVNFPIDRIWLGAQSSSAGGSTEQKSDKGAEAQSDIRRNGYHPPRFPAANRHILVPYLLPAKEHRCCIPTY